MPPSEPEDLRGKPGKGKGQPGKGEGTPPGEESAADRRPGSVFRPSWWQIRSRKLVATAKWLHTQAESRFPVISHLAARMVSVNIFDSATRLAAQCFLTAVPLLFVVASFAPEAVRNQLISSVRAVFGLAGAANDQLNHVYQSSTDTLREATGVVGGLMLLLSATAVSRAMQRLCKRAWEVPRAGTRIAAWRWLVWIGIWLAVLIVQAPLRDGFGAGLWLGIPVTVVTQTALWWWTQHLLLGGLIRWPPLLPGAVITAVAVTLLSIGARFYMPRALNRALSEYGSVGSVFVLLSWLIVVCAAIAVGICAGAVVAQEPFLARRLGSPPPTWQKGGGT
ncbi:YhjD/YihY/BrkB family envelope integrity protein [Streptomyces sp. NPDC048479]|uniref:YhjD/YihY/BrkB family envelope integrity protein n=1 Tax=Streptomyces sp. NPDC048479 TaxID=3154725 RepID=UPI003436839C